MKAAVENCNIRSIYSLLGEFIYRKHETILAYCSQMTIRRTFQRSHLDQCPLGIIRKRKLSGFASFPVPPTRATPTVTATLACTTRKPFWSAALAWADSSLTNAPSTFAWQNCISLRPDDIVDLWQRCFLCHRRFLRSLPTDSRCAW